MPQEIPIGNLRKILIHVNKNSRFYRKRFKQYGIDPKKIKSIQDFQEIPFTTREDLAKNNPYDFLCVPESDVEQIRFSSGTVGENPVFGFRRTNIHDYDFKESTLSKYPNAKRVLLLITPKAIPFYQILCKKLRKILMIGDVYRLSVAASKASKAGIDTIVSTPARTLKFAEYLKKHYDTKKIKLLDLTGEGLTSLKKKMLREKYPKAEIINSYGMTEIGFIGFQCSEIDKHNKYDIYHIYPDRFLYEVINPEARKPVKSGETGELVLTNLKKATMPLVRYRTGDMVQFLNKKCRCDANGSFMRYLGRTGFDFIIIANLEIHMSEVEKTIHSLKKYVTDDFQMVVSEKNVSGSLKTKIKINLVLKKGLTEKRILKTIKEGIENNLCLHPHYYLRKITLKSAIKMGTLLPLEINFVSKIPESYKSKRLIDQR